MLEMFDQLIYFLSKMRIITVKPFPCTPTIIFTHGYA